VIRIRSGRTFNMTNLWLNNIYNIGIVAELPELFRFKCASHRYTADTNSTHFKRNNPLVCRVFAWCNHGSIGLKQVYLARRRVYNHTTAHQLLVHNILNIITNASNFSMLIQTLFENHKLGKLV
jgi:hypothetical protein